MTALQFLPFLGLWLLACFLISSNHTRGRAKREGTPSPQIGIPLFLILGAAVAWLFYVGGPPPERKKAVKASPSASETNVNAPTSE